MWSICPYNNYLRDQKNYEKKRPDELAAVLANFQRFMEILNAVDDPMASLLPKYIHTEGNGVLAATERAAKRKLQKTRLYFFPNKTDQTVYLLAIGSADTQKDDIKKCHKIVKQLTG